MKRKSVRLTLTLSSLLLIFSASFSVELVSSEPAKRTVGVRIGDVVKYGDFLSFWASNRPSATVPQDLIDANNTVWIANTILDVAGTTVTYQTLTRYENGTETSDIGQIDVETGDGNGTLTFVSAALTAGDKVYTLGELSVARMNSTFPRAYLGQTRETNLLNVTHYSFVSVDSRSVTQSVFLWNKATGVLVEQRWAFADFEGDYLTMASVEYKIVDTTIWVDDPDAEPPDMRVFVIVIFGVLLLAGWYFFRRR